MANSRLSCLSDTGSDVKLLGNKHLRRFDEANQRYDRRPCQPQIISGALGHGTETAHERVIIRRLVLETGAGQLEVQNVHFFLVPNAPEMILGTPFTQEIGFDAPAWMISNYADINGMDLDEK